MSARYPGRRSHPDVDAALLDVPSVTPGDQIPLEEGCALLGARVDTFRDQYLTSERWDASAKRFGIMKHARGRVTVSRRLILEQLDAVRRDPWGGGYGPSGPWARRVRDAWADVSAYDTSVRARVATHDVLVNAPAAEADPQGDLFAR